MDGSLVTPEMLAEWLEPLITDTSFELLELKIQPLPGRPKFVVVLDHREHGITIDELASFSRRFEDELDRRPEVPRAYALDVTSPGADRELQRDWEYQKNIGRKLTVELVPDPGEKTGEQFEAVLSAVEGNTLLFEDGRSVDRAAVRHAHVTLPW